MKIISDMVLVSAVLSLVVWGCTTKLSGYNPTWEKNTLREELPFAATDVHRAAVSALVEKEYTVLEDKSVLGSITIKSITINGEPIEISIRSLKEADMEKISPDLRTVLEKESEFLSAITIRIGVAGNRERSREVLESVHSYLH